MTSAAAAATPIAAQSDTKLASSMEELGREIPRAVMALMEAVKFHHENDAKALENPVPILERYRVAALDLTNLLKRKHKIEALGPGLKCCCEGNLRQVLVISKYVDFIFRQIETLPKDQSTATFRVHKAGIGLHLNALKHFVDAGLKYDKQPLLINNFGHSAAEGHRTLRYEIDLKRYHDPENPLPNTKPNLPEGVPANGEKPSRETIKNLAQAGKADELNAYIDQHQMSLDRDYPGELINSLVHFFMYSPEELEQRHFDVLEVIINAGSPFNFFQDENVCPNWIRCIFYNWYQRGFNENNAIRLLEFLLKRFFPLDTDFSMVFRGDWQNADRSSRRLIQFVLDKGINLVNYDDAPNHKVQSLLHHKAIDELCFIIAAGYLDQRIATEAGAQAFLKECEAHPADRSYLIAEAVRLRKELSASLASNVKEGLGKELVALANAHSSGCTGNLIPHLPLISEMAVMTNQQVIAQIWRELTAIEQRHLAQAAPKASTEPKTRFVHTVTSVATWVLKRFTG